MSPPNFLINKQCNFHLIKSNHFNEIEAGHEGKINVIMHAYENMTRLTRSHPDSVEILNLQQKIH